MTGALSSFTGGGKSKGGGGIPFTLSGTTSNPIFLPDLGGMAKGLGQTAQERLVARRRCRRCSGSFWRPFREKEKVANLFPPRARNGGFASRRRRVAKLRFRQSTAEDFGE